MYGRSSCSGNRSSSSGGVVVTTSRTITSHTQTAPTVRGDLSAPQLLPNCSSGAPVQQLRLFGSPPIPRFHSGAPPPPPPPREGGCTATTTYASPATQLASQPAPGREELGPPPRILLPPSFPFSSAVLRGWGTRTTQMGEMRVRVACAFRRINATGGQPASRPHGLSVSFLPCWAV